jgi:hypothetical protein
MGSLVLKIPHRRAWAYQELRRLENIKNRALKVDNYEGFLRRSLGISSDTMISGLDLHFLACWPYIEYQPLYAVVRTKSHRGLDCLR